MLLEVFEVVELLRADLAAEVGLFGAGFQVDLRVLDLGLAEPAIVGTVVVFHVLLQFFGAGKILLALPTDLQVQFRSDLRYDTSCSRIFSGVRVLVLANVELDHPDGLFAEDAEVELVRNADVESEQSDHRESLAADRTGGPAERRKGRRRKTEAATGVGGLAKRQ